MELKRLPEDEDDGAWPIFTALGSTHLTPFIRFEELISIIIETSHL
jgi:hypothetical protein